MGRLRVAEKYPRDFTKSFVTTKNALGTRVMNVPAEFKAYITLEEFLERQRRFDDEAIIKLFGDIFFIGPKTLLNVLPNHLGRFIAPGEVAVDDSFRLWSILVVRNGKEVLEPRYVARLITTVGRNHCGYVFLPTEYVRKMSLKEFIETFWRVPPGTTVTTERTIPIERDDVYLFEVVQGPMLLVPTAEYHRSDKNEDKEGEESEQEEAA